MSDADEMRVAIANGTVARIRVERGETTEFPVAEKMRGGWQTGVHHYLDETVSKVLGVYVHRPEQSADLAKSIEGNELDKEMRRIGPPEPSTSDYIALLIRGSRHRFAPEQHEIEAAARIVAALPSLGFAVEAAVRADQIEKDAALVENSTARTWVIAAAAIRAQLTEGNGDE